MIDNYRCIYAAKEKCNNSVKNYVSFDDKVIIVVVACHPKEL